MSSMFRRGAWATFAGLALAVGGGAASGCSAAEDAPAPSSSEGCLGASSQAVKVCASGPTLRGIDVSYYQGDVDWMKVKAAGNAFAFARVSDGVDYPDSKFAQNWPAMKNAGVVRGLYQFFRPAKDIDAQVDLLVTKVAAAGGFHPGDLPPVLDLETDGGLPAATVVTRAKAWIAQIEATYGVKPIVYLAPFFSNKNGIGAHFSSYTLWVANYKTTCPTVPDGWTDWHFWQDADTGTVDGIKGAVDTNFFNGDLMKLAGVVHQVPVEPVEPAEPVIVPPHYADPIGDYQGATLGSGQKDDASEAPPADPCAR